jgi:predicted RNA-binding Zn-ribbon protein involved in translation (DUF1610 family)
VREDYLIAKCYRCGSTSQLLIKGVRNNVFLCPACLEGEIGCKVKQPDTQGHQAGAMGIHTLGSYVTTLVKLSIN